DQARQLGYWEIDREVFEMVVPRTDVTDLTEEQIDIPAAAAIIDVPIVPSAPIAMPAAAVGPGQFNTAAAGPGQFNTAAAGPGQFNTAPVRESVAVGPVDEMRSTGPIPMLAEPAESLEPVPTLSAPVASDYADAEYASVDYGDADHGDVAYANGYHTADANGYQ